MGVGAGLYMYVVIVQKFTFAISSHDQFLFVCASNISGNAERICAKFTVKTCLVAHSDEFLCQGQRSKVKVIREKIGKTAALSPLTMYCKTCTVRYK